MSTPNPEEMLNKLAVVGMAGRFPGSKNLHEFWDNLVEGRNTIKIYTEQELLDAGVSAEQLAQPDYVRAMGAYERPFDFDASFFGYNPREAEILDPQHRVFLEHSWAALEDAGYDPMKYGGRIGVFGGGGVSQYLFEVVRDTNLMASLDSISLVTSNDKDYLATRVGYKLDLRGPCVNLQTACSTSLVAIVQAAQSLLNYQCDMVLAGGVRVDPNYGRGYLYNEGGINSPDGVVRTFDVDAKGTVFANGVGVVVMKRLEDAIADKDTIHAVVLGYGLSNDGSGRVGFTAPGVEGQVLATSDSISMAGINPDTISYVECHGTATPLGDPIEITALTKSFRMQTEKKGYCAVGSVKTNIGHTDAAAGVAGFLKTVLALKNRTLPASLNFRKPNPAIDFENSPFYVNASLAPWTRKETPLRALVNSFGMGGTNANVVLEESPFQEPTGPSRATQLVLLSARTRGALDRMSANLAVGLAGAEANHFADAAYTLQVGRRAFAHRRFLLARDAGSCAEVLGTEGCPGAVTVQRDKDKSSVAFLFPGQGAQHPNMAREVYEAEPLFRSTVDRCCELLKPALGLDLRDLLFPAADKYEEAAELLAQTANTQPALFVVEYALAKLWMEWGLSPEGMIGHSVGEYVAACLAGVFTLEDALSLIAARGRLMGQLPAGSMAGVLLPVEELRALLEPHGGLSIAAINSPSSCVVSGPFPDMERFEAELSAKGTPFRRLNTSHAFHSSMMDPIFEAFVELVRSVPRNSPNLPYLSNVTGTWIRAEEATDPVYWAKHLRQAVLFSDGVAELLRAPGKVLLEVGPGSTLTGLAAQHPEKTPDCALISSLPRPTDKDQDAFDTLLLNLGRLWSEGVTIDWDRFHAREDRRRVPLPTYPFEHHEYRLPFGRGDQGSIKSANKHKKLEDMADWFNVPSWKRTGPVLAPEGSESGRWLIFMDDRGLGTRLADRLEASGHDVVRVVQGAGYAREEKVFSIRPGEREDYASLLKELRSGDRVPTDIVHLWSLRPATPGPIDLGETGEATDASFYSILFLAAALGVECPGVEMNLRVVTCDAQNVSGEECVAPFNAMVAGPVKSVSREQPNVRSQWIDVQLPEAEGSSAWGELTRSLIGESLGGTKDEVVAYRRGWRWVQTFEPVHVEATAQEHPALREKGVYLITGGLGGVGLAFAEHLATAVRADLVLVTRSGLPPREDWSRWLRTRGEQDGTSAKILSILRLEEQGARVLVMAADVADLRQMEQVVARAKQEFGPIRGVINAAGVPGQGIIELKTREAANQVLSPKVAGTLVLDQVLQNEPLDFFVICSSLIGFIGFKGQSDYSSANSFIGAFVNSGRHRSPVAPLAIDYDRWDGIGMAAFTPGGASQGDPRLEYEEVQHPVFAARFRKGEELNYVAYLDPQKHWVVGEHFLRGMPTMVGTSYVELVRSAFLYGTGEAQAEIRDVVFMGALMMDAQERRELRVALKDHEGVSDFEIKSLLPNGQWQTHAVGKIARPAGYTPEKLDLQGILGRCPTLHASSMPETKAEGETESRVILQPLVQCGQRWNNLVSIVQGNNEAMATLSLPEAYLADIGPFGLHPALLDAATSFAVQFASKGASYLPFAYNRMRVNRPLTPRMHSYARFQPAATDTDEFLSFDLVLMDEQGEELARIDGYGMKRVANVQDPSAELKSGGPIAVAAKASPFISAKEGMEVFRRVLSLPGVPQVVVATKDLETALEEAQDARNAQAEAPKEEGSLATRYPRPSLSTPFVAPRNPLEESIAAIWQSLLGIEEVGVHDNFMDLGGHSLVAIQLTARIREMFEIELSVASFYKNPTVEGVTQAVVETLVGSVDAETMAQAISNLQQV